MINWFIIIFIVFAIIVLFKVTHIKHSRKKLSIIIIIILLTFIVVSMYFVAKENDIDMTTVNGFSAGIKVYAGWLLNSFQNVKTLTGYAIGLDWSSKNKSISNDAGLIDKTSKAGGNIINSTIRKIKPNTPKPITNYK